MEIEYLYAAFVTCMFIRVKKKLTKMVANSSQEPFIYFRQKLINYIKPVNHQEVISFTLSVSDQRKITSSVSV